MIKTIFSVNTARLINFQGTKTAKRYITGGHTNSSNESKLRTIRRRVAAAVCMLSATAIGLEHRRKVKCYERRFEKVEKADSHLTNYEESHQTAVENATELLQRVKDETGCPGIVAAVGVNGRVMWSTGIGFADVENRVPCTKNTVMRIASVSKPITVTLLAKLYEKGKLDLDKPVHEYVSAWPKSLKNDHGITITTRHLLSHLSGIRHYDKNPKKNKSVDEEAEKGQHKKPLKEKDGANDSGKAKEGSPTENAKENTAAKTDQLKTEYNSKEHLSKKTFSSVTKSLELFKNDPLIYKPGTEYLYSTHAYTLLAAVAEAVGKRKLPEMLKTLFEDLEMKNTYLDQHEPIIYHRSRFYVRNTKGRLVNSPYVDVSYKWAGGGMLSTVGDLVKFGNAMLYSYQHSDSSGISCEGKSGYLKQETVKMLWKPVVKTKKDFDSGMYYAMGWAVLPPPEDPKQWKEVRFQAQHTGGAIGCSSVLLVLPVKTPSSDRPLPQGVVVSIMTNLQGISLSEVAGQIAKEFEQFANK